jgi:glycerol-3-phosphate dehydrogenase
MTSNQSTIQTDICVVGAGVVGLLTALGLSRLGLSCVLVEQSFPGAGASLHCGGVLHSGARYAVADPELAKLCFGSSQRLQRDYPFAIDASKPAYYVGFSDQHFEYSQQLSEHCESYGCPVQYLSAEKILGEEPNLNRAIEFAVEVPDYVINPADLIISCLQSLKKINTPVLYDTKITSAERDLKGWSLSAQSNEQAIQIQTKGLMITSGSWSTSILKNLFNISIPVQYINGSMVVLAERLLNRIISLCDVPSSGDSAIPCHDSTLLGSTWSAQDSFTPTQIGHTELDEVLQKASTLLSHQTLHCVSHSYSGVRSVLPDPGANAKLADRLTHRGYYVLDCEKSHGLSHVVVAFGGKMSLCQNMATAAINTLLEQMGMNAHDSIDFSLSPSSSEIAIHLASRDKSQLVKFAS